MIRVWIGYDPREAIAYHVCSQSIIKHAQQPVSIHPLAQSLLHDYKETHVGTNAFIHTRFLIPCLQDWSGWAIWMDGDMALTEDIGRLWRMRDDRYAVQCVRHFYQTRAGRKYIGTPLENDNFDYPKKQWSSVILWNCAHPANRVLTMRYVEQATSQHLHRFEWLDDDDIGSLPHDWNWLPQESHANPNAKLLHWTLGVPSIPHYTDSTHAKVWHQNVLDMLNVDGVSATDIVERATVAVKPRDVKIAV